MDVVVKRKQVIYAIFLLTIWKIWLYQNEKLFNGKHFLATRIVEEIQENSFFLLLYRIFIR
ncbi:hypothetical protein HanRHA438_Chr11g0483691 [Helianthus annuus]|nr:hypothetical protein HanIR_Chr11g0506431 [Helianthus annuus]KAJ0868937.1 hypothetical protein HanRHA438_Chr11g0483691 [Helianthus annuus]